MKVGDKVYLEDRESEIIAISYDEQGEKIYTVKDSPKDYYEHDFYEFMHSELSATQNLLEEYKEAYADYQELGKEYSKLQDEYEEFKNQINFNKQRFKCIQEMAETNKKMGELLIKLIDIEEGDHIPRID